MTLLSDYIISTAELPWQWGVQDCTMWAADWCVLRWGFDPAERYRGTYRSQAEADIIAEKLLEIIAMEIRMPMKTIAADGDVGLIRAAGRDVAAIRSGEHWAFRKPGGVGMARRDAIAIWGY